MPIDPISGTTGSTPTTSGSSKETSFMGKEDFLKLLVAQLKHQDPSSPTDMNGMTEQMTQFSILEQLTNLASSSQESNVSLARTHAIELLGKTVTYRAPDGSSKEGVVEHVDTSATAPRLTIGGTANLLLADVVSVS